MWLGISVNDHWEIIGSAVLIPSLSYLSIGGWQVRDADVIIALRIARLSGHAASFVCNEYTNVVAGVRGIWFSL